MENMLAEGGGTIQETKEAGRAGEAHGVLLQGSVSSPHRPPRPHCETAKATHGHAFCTSEAMLIQKPCPARADPLLVSPRAVPVLSSTSQHRPPKILHPEANRSHSPHLPRPVLCPRGPLG